MKNIKLSQSLERKNKKVDINNSKSNRTKVTTNNIKSNKIKNNKITNNGMNIYNSKNSAKNNISSSVPKKQYVRRRSEVYGIIIIMFSILFFLSFFKFGQPGILNQYVNDFFSFVFGVVKYLVSLLLFLWGISFFIKKIKNTTASQRLF